MCPEPMKRGKKVYPIQIYDEATGTTIIMYECFNIDLRPLPGDVRKRWSENALKRKQQLKGGRR